MKQVYVKWAAAGAAALAGLVLLDAWVLEQYFFEVKTFDIGKKNSQRKLKLVHVSDLHFRQTLWPFYQKLARKINRLQPDLLLITGDLIDLSGRPGPLRRFFHRLHPSITKIAIPGNHDHLSDVSIGTLKKILEQHNGHLLRNESRAFMVGDQRIMITGLDDFIESNASFKEAVKEVGREEHHLLLVHSPLQQEVVQKELERINAARSSARQLNIQYIFAGHNHGGQVRFFNHVPILPKKSGHYINGWYNNQPPYLYVSKGFGTSAIPFRFFARSEVTVFYYGF